MGRKDQEEGRLHSLHMCTHAHIPACIHTRTRMHTRTRAHTYTHTYARTHKYTMHARMYAHNHTHTRTYTTHAHTYANTHTHIHTHVGVRMHAYVRVHTRVHTHAGAAHKSRRPSPRLALCLLIMCCPPRIARIGAYYLGVFKPRIGYGTLRYYSFGTTDQADDCSN